MTGPTHGTVTIAASGAFTTPRPQLQRGDSFTFNANDGSSDSNIAVSIRDGRDDAPAAAANAYTISEDAMLTVAAPGVWGTTPTWTDLTAVLVDGRPRALSSTPTGRSRTLTANYNGPDSFTYRRTMGIASNVGRVAYGSAVNDALKSPRTRR